MSAAFPIYNAALHYLVQRERKPLQSPANGVRTDAALLRRAVDSFREVDGVEEPNDLQKRLRYA